MSESGRLVNYGPKLDTAYLRDLYAPRETERRSMPAAGIDNLSLSARDTFLLADGRELEIELEGYFRVARAAPTSDDWATGAVQVNMIDLYLTGEDSELGPMSVTLNPEITSAGQTFPSRSPDGVQKCRIATAAIFRVLDHDITLYNAEPVLLMNDSIDSIPPVEDPNGHAHIYMLPLYHHSSSRFDGDRGQPGAYLTSLTYTVGNYLTEEDAGRFREA